jgi:hypothetical protein
LFPWVWSGRDMKLTTHLHLVSRIISVELYLRSTIRRDVLPPFSGNYTMLQPKYLSPKNRYSEKIKIYYYVFFLFSWGVLRQRSLGTSVTNWPIVPARMIDDYGAFGGIRTDRGNQSTRSKPAPVPHCRPQIPYYLNWDGT